MKNVIKLFGVIALIAVIGFSMSACGGGGSDDDDINGGDDIIGGDGWMGSTLKITNAQVYKLQNYVYDTLIEFTGSDPNLNYIDFFNGEDISLKSLNELIEGNPTVTLTSGKLNITLGKPKASSLQNWSSGSGITVSTTNVKVFEIYSFYSDPRGYNTIQISQTRSRIDGQDWVIYMYVDKNVKISGKNTYGNDSVTYAMNLKAGWNSVIHSTRYLPDGVDTTYQTRMPDAIYWQIPW